VKNRAFPTVVWVLLGILAIGAVSLTLGRNDSETFPSASSYSPSGTKAFADLLTSLGNHVTITQATKPRLEQTDVVIAFAPNTAFSSPDARTVIDDFVEKGGRAIVLSVPKVFPKTPLPSTDTNIAPANENTTTITNVSNFGADSNQVDAQLTGLPYEASRQNSFTIAQTESGTAFANLQRIGQGQVLAISDGIIATNRFIDRNGNAAELMRLVQAIAPPHSSFTFYEASFGHASERGVLERIGAWALAAWWQLLFLFVVIVYSLGKPFGYPDEERPKQGGSRELVDAVAATYRRAHATHVALRAMMKEADSEIRKKLKLPLDSSRADRDALIPQSLAKALATAQVASTDRISDYDALGIARTLDEELAAFLGERVVRYRRRKYS